jgi:hypothetical protein
MQLAAKWHCVRSCCISYNFRSYTIHRLLNAVPCMLLWCGARCVGLHRRCLRGLHQESRSAKDELRQCSLLFQRYVASNGNRTVDATSFANTDRLLRHIQSVYSIEYLTIVNTTKHIMCSVNADRQGEVFDPAGVVTKAETSGVTVYGSGAPVWTNALLTYELLKENPPVIRDRCVYNGRTPSFLASILQLKIALLAL